MNFTQVGDLIKNPLRCVCIIRHGESEGNKDTNIYLTMPGADIPLTKKGIGDAEKCAKTLYDSLTQIFGPYLPNPVIYTSTFRRAIQTAEEVAKVLPAEIVQNVLLCEQDYGMATGQSMTDFINSTPGEAEICNRVGRTLYRPPRGESIRDVFVRCGLFVEQQNWLNRQLSIIVAHKVSCSMLRSYLTPDNALNTDWENCKCEIYDVVPRKARLIGFIDKTT